MLNKPVRLSTLYKTIVSQLEQPGKVSNQDVETVKKLTPIFSTHYPLHILIAEDNPVNQMLAERVLTKLGYKPDKANNGLEAISLLNKKNYDVILMDVQMPVMDGLEATQKIRAQAGVQPIIIAMTANAMQGDREICLQAGMDDYISKPIKVEDLTSRLEKFARKIIV